MLAAWLVLFFAYVGYMCWAVANGLVHPWGVTGAMLAFLTSMFPSIITAARNGWRLLSMWWDYRPLGGPGEWNTNTGLWFVALFLVKLVVILTCAYYAGLYFNMGFYVPL